ncbi:MAG: hypothetical protein LBI49_04505 [Nocardiopsaceae bacterium]|jgi:hypothetical protein|nr:hypothetical protein [Nocardiopsaceae bacterium]
MNLPASQQRILHDVEHRLRADEPGLELAFAAFARATPAGKVPAAEQLDSWRARAARQVGRARLIHWPALASVTGLIVAGVLIGLVIGLPMVSAAHQARCWHPLANAPIAGRCQQPVPGHQPGRSGSGDYRPVQSFPGHRQLP